MHIKIPLPPFDAVLGAGAHPYPYQIAQQTQEFIRASVWYDGTTKVATNLFLRGPWKLWRMRQIRREFTVTDSAWNNAFKAFQKYPDVFRSSVLQTGLISLKSHWDWYITKSAEFVKFAAVQTQSGRIDAAMQTKLEGLGENRSIEGQVQILCDVAQIKIDFSRADRDAVRELRLVRNLGLHNRWEVNDRYMRDSANSSLWELGDLRTLSIDEVENWAGVITKLTTNIGIELAVKFRKAPPYPS